jgi:hypothetical protein
MIYRGRVPIEPAVEASEQSSKDTKARSAGRRPRAARKRAECLSYLCAADGRERAADGGS